MDYLYYIGRNPELYIAFPNKKVAFSNIVCYDMSMIEFYETSYDMASKRNADMEPILFGYEHCQPSHSYGPTIRAYHLFHFVTHGCGMLRIDGRSFALEAGDAFLIPAEQVAYYEASRTDPWVYHWVGVTGLRASQYVRQIMDLTAERYVLRGLDIGRYAAAIDRAAELTGTNAVNYFQSKLALDEVFLYLAAELPGLRSTRYVPSLASRVKAYLEARYSEKLTIGEVAEQFGVHPNHLSRAFRQEYQLSPKQFLMNLKLEKSRQMLMETDTPLTLIASLLGFEDQHAFSRSFKNHYGISPSLCRAAALEQTN